MFLKDNFNRIKAKPKTVPKSIFTEEGKSWFTVVSM